MGEALERVAPSSALAAFSAEDLELIRRFVAPESSDHELAFFLEFARARGLNPFEGELVGVPRWNARAQRKVMSIQVTVRGERTLAERTGLYGGQDEPQWCGPDARWLEVWLAKDPPAAARVAVYRKDWDRPAVGVARYASYVQLGKNGEPVEIWKTAPDFMLAKCAEANALRKAFPGGARELSAASRVSMEARAAGLDDDGRHQLVEEVTNGRTSSSRELTDDEVFEVRAEIARLGGEAAPDGVDPDTGEILGPDETPNEDPPSEEELERRRLVAELVPRARALGATERAALTGYLDSSGIGAAKKTNDYSLDELRQVEGWLEILEEPF